MNRVRVAMPEVRGDTLVGDVAATGDVARFFSGEPFRATYSEPVDRVPDHLRPIPVLAHVCPVAWATGADVVVDRVDGRFLDALREVRSTLLSLYPEFMTGGSVYCPNPVRETAEPGSMEDAGMLFTGGVDSTATYVRNREPNPTLINVRGWVVGEDDDEEWNATRDHVESFADEWDLDARFVESNMLSFLRAPLLQAHFQRYLEGAWYSSVGHGLGLLGLCAPLAHVEGIGTIHIAATHTSDWSKPWGSRPDIDERVRWDGTEGSHDGYELTRQDKLDLIAEYADEGDESLALRTCSYDAGAGNCADCEKCYRTIVGLLLAGPDPNDFGYKYGRETLDRIRDRFERGDLYVSAQKAYHWNVLQDAARARGFGDGDTDVDGDADAEGDADANENTRAFFEWLDAQDFDTYVESSERSFSHRALQGVARVTPTSVYSAVYPVYRRIAGSAH